MKTVKLIGKVDEHDRLCLEVPPTVPPGPVQVVIGFGVTDDDDAGKWAAAVAQSWADDWSDPREDIYTSEDGKPLDAPR
ncbi:MAG: hypothetical protein E6K70_26260 [Planctomycetota bacterium]|nr:MAG: hypothetical protein E6K70_26260 [Planctomycetota bacterium]